MAELGGTGSEDPVHESIDSIRSKLETVFSIQIF